MLDGGCFSGPISAAAIGTALSTTLKISSITYELKAVSENAKDLLDSTKHVSDNLQTAKNLRRQKSIHFDTNEKKWIDGVLANTEKTLSNVAALIEPARVDMQTKFGSVGLLNRGLFVFRDSPKVQTHLARLSIASGSLDTVLNVLCTREGRSTLMPSLSESRGWSSMAMSKRKSCASLRSEASAPPAYQIPESELESLEALHNNLSTRSLEEAPRFAAVTQSPVDELEEPICSATWGISPTRLTTGPRKEPVNPLLMHSWSRYYSKEAIVAVQEISELDCHPLESPDSAEPRNYGFEVESPGSTITSGSSAQRLHKHKSMSSFTGSLSPTESNLSRTTSSTSEQSIRPSGRERGRAWMAHQASK